MNILYVGDIVGSPGRLAFARVAGAMKSRGDVDFIVANGENAARGRGLTPALAAELFQSGADVITLGDHAWDQKDMVSGIDNLEKVLRPANLPPECPGRGHVIVQVPDGPRVAVVIVMGRVFMKPCECPYRAMDALLAGELGSADVILAEIHAEATSEKIIFGRRYDGRVASVVGTHTHVQTSDDTILPKGTAYITDLGMTGPKDSAIGRDLQSTMHTMLTGMPTRFEVGRDDVMLEGVVVELDKNSLRPRAIRRIREKLDSGE